MHTSYLETIVIVFFCSKIVTSQIFYSSHRCQQQTCAKLFCQDLISSSTYSYLLPRWTIFVFLLSLRSQTRFNYSRKVSCTITRRQLDCWGRIRQSLFTFSQLFDCFYVRQSKSLVVGRKTNIQTNKLDLS